VRNLEGLLSGLGHPHLLVLGDIMLDRYTWGDAERISPEAPVLVLRAEREEVRPGGAASVAALLRALDAEVTLVGVVGDDANGRVIRTILAESDIKTDGVFLDPERPTTTKHRFMARAAHRNPQQILRVDQESATPLPASLEQRMFDVIAEKLVDCQAVLISDYAKGACTPSLLRRTIDAAANRGVRVIVDPGRIPDCARYEGVYAIKPNRFEAASTTGVRIVSPQDAMQAGRQLCQQLRAEAVIVTLDAEGMVLATPQGPDRWFATTPRTVCDVTGAGDTALAMMGICLACTVPLPEAIQLANLAAGLQVERLGVASVSRVEILAELRPASNGKKQVTLDEMVALAESCRRTGRSLVFTNGCFDLLHVGHITYLQEAAAQGDVLVVGLNSDRSVRALKGPTRPVMPEAERASLLAALACVAHVVLFDEATPEQVIHRLRPDVLVKGGNYSVEDIVGKEYVESYGGKVCVTGLVSGRSTTELLSEIRMGHKGHHP
jgi:D-beta-D-heptose 7-phosphate kinase / D-beta-D-heptose 1-phosphate adenosyltransferase